MHRVRFLVPIALLLLALVATGCAARRPSGGFPRVGVIGELDAGLAIAARAKLQKHPELPGRDAVTVRAAGRDVKLRLVQSFEDPPGERDRAILVVDGTTGTFEREDVHDLGDGLLLAVMDVENGRRGDEADVVLFTRR